MANGLTDVQEAEEQEKSSEEVARELANPNTPLASLNFKNQFRLFDGDFPGADGETSYILLFQPSMPFLLANGDLILFRPAIPLLVEQPLPVLRGQTIALENLDFDDKTGLGDIAFDLAYARTTKSGILFAAGLISSLPTATSDRLGSEQWTLGPELLVGKLTKTYILGLFPNHQWDVAGSGDHNISLTTIQLFGIYLPGGGWNLGTSPTMTYDWESEQWTVPLNFTIGKTVIFGKRPWKLSVEVNYYVERPDVFGPDWMFVLTSK